MGGGLRAGLDPRDTPRPFPTVNDSESYLPAHADEPGEVGLVLTEDFTSTEPLTFENGQSLPGFTLRYETYGRLNPARDNAILICHALSGDHHCAGINSYTDRKLGWWNNMIGPGKPIDTEKYFVICSNCIGGCQGSSGPSSINPATGKPYALDFPIVSISDFVQAQARLVDHLGIDTLYSVIGGSMGGMQALQWGISFPDRVRKLIPMACTARQSAQAIAFNEVGRLAIMQDPAWKGGDYSADHGPDVGLAVARMMAHITYLSDEGMDQKFGRRRRKNEARSLFDVEFEVESYLRYQGRSFVNRFDANSYLYLTKALDRFDLYGESGDLEDSLETINARTLVIGFTTDWLFPPSQNRAIVHALLRSGREATYAEIASTLGHDSFLVKSDRLYSLVRTFLASN